MPFLILFGIIAAAVLAWFCLQRWRRARQEHLFQQALPDEQVQLLQDRVGLYQLLPAPLKQELHGRINIFLDEKEFIGCAGLEITDEIRLTIAGNACILLLKRDKRCFPGFSSILVYPETYIAEEVQRDGLIEARDLSSRAGESWHRGPVVLSWSDIIRGTRNERDGHNVVLHEFAHKLDEENTIMDGLPVLRHSEDYRQWSEVLSHEYGTLVKQAEHHHKGVLDNYGAVSPPEFFAVATETFFEKSLEMKRKLPELYRQLQTFYGLDPATWHLDAGGNREGEKNRQD